MSALRRAKYQISQVSQRHFEIPESAELVLKTESYSVEALIEEAIRRIAP